MLLLILDHRPAYLRSARAEVSLLMLPLGTGSLLDHVTEQLAAVSGLRSGKLVIVPTFRPDRDYKRRVRTRVSSGVNVMGPGGLARALGACEPADYVLLVDPLRWPVTGSDLAAAVERHRDYQSANHMIAVGADPEGTRERVEYDRRGRVARVQRLFNRVNWPEVAATCIFLSIAPALAIRGVRFRSLGELRSALCGKGVLSRDVPLPLDLVDLSTAEGVLALNEKLLPQVTRDGSRPGFVARGEGVLVGRGCHIDPSSRFVGPVIVQERAIIEARATIVGPTVVGAGSRIREGATVADAVLTDRAEILAGDTVRHRLVCGRGSASATDPRLPLFSLCRLGPATIPAGHDPPPNPSCRPLTGENRFTWLPSGHWTACFPWPRCWCCRLSCSRSRL